MSATRFILMFEIWMPVAAYSLDETFLKQQVDTEPKYVNRVEVIQIVQNDKRRPTWTWTCCAPTPNAAYSRYENLLVAARSWQRKKKETILCVCVPNPKSFWNCAELQSFVETIQSTVNAKNVFNAFLCIIFIFVCI